MPLITQNLQYVHHKIEQTTFEPQISASNSPVLFAAWTDQQGERSQFKK